MVSLLWKLFSPKWSSRGRLRTYVLEPKLRDNGKLPKWSPCTRRGQFLGFSPVHSSTVGLIRNLRTGLITPQFHCVYDSEFETVLSNNETPPDW
jgi:hypothetical protein